MGDEFLTRVSPAGVPHTLTHSNNISAAPLYPITPQLACKFYWMLSSLDVAYAYVINGVQVARTFSVFSLVAPKNRMISPATFYKTGYDSQTQTSYVVELFLNTVYLDAENNSNVGFRLNFEESDNFNFIKLCQQPVSGMSNVSLQFELSDVALKAYLNYNASMVTSASLINFSITPQFFTI